jgi:hypothetical protein
MRARAVCLFAMSIGAVSCVSNVGGGDDDGGDDDQVGDDDGGGADPDGGGPAVAPCATPLQVPLSGRPVDVMPPQRLGQIAGRMPCVADGWLRDTIESADTVWYDKASLVPGYQDSFGDNVVTPIGMRPNTIDPELINLAVPGGHAQIFQAMGVFHFPFGTPIGPVEDVVVVDFWQPPRDGAGFWPVVWWRRDPNEYTHRVEWMFPAGTHFGEMLFMRGSDGALDPFEIRTRTRTTSQWEVDIYRPFPRAADLGAAIEARRADKPEWASNAELDALVAHLANTTTLDAEELRATHFASAFATRDGWRDVLPDVTGDARELIRELLRTTPFVSARGIPWKESGASKAWASTGGVISPEGFNAGTVEVSEQSCDSCHQDAGRPFETWYPNIIAYGELWGNDEIFTWHPFTIDAFVDENGEVVDFNYDNRELRPDFTSAGLLAPYDEGDHPDTVYERIVREWTDWSY